CPRAAASHRRTLSTTLNTSLSSTSKTSSTIQQDATTCSGQTRWLRPALRQTICSSNPSVQPPRRRITTGSHPTSATTYTTAPSQPETSTSHNSSRKY